MRAIPGIPVDRAKLRTTALYDLTDALRVGIEWNPIGEDLGPLANWRFVDESERRPALVLGTSSDRIGTEKGRAVYLTASKDLERLLGIPVAPYAGATYSTEREELDTIGGLHVRWRDRWSTTHLYDGRNVHHLLGYRAGEGHSVSLVLVEQDGTHYLGASFGFGVPLGAPSATMDSQDD